jgi:hypothetical protein
MSEQINRVAMSKSPVDFKLLDLAIIVAGVEQENTKLKNDLRSLQHDYDKLYDELIATRKERNTFQQKEGQT